jgi:hypothetical protein
MADIMNYIIRFSDRCGIDLNAAVLRKMQMNG